MRHQTPLSFNIANWCLRKRADTNRIWLEWQSNVVTRAKQISIVYGDFDGSECGFLAWYIDRENITPSDEGWETFNTNSINGSPLATNATMHRRRYTNIKTIEEITTMAIVHLRLFIRNNCNTARGIFPLQHRQSGQTYWFICNLWSR